MGNRRSPRHVEVATPYGVSGVARSALGWLAGATAAADDAQSVVVSIAPLHSLVAGVMGDVGTPQLIVRGRASPHGYQMRPSQAAALNRAGLVVWVGGALEGFLKRPLARLDATTRVIEAMAIDDMLLLDARAAGVWRCRFRRAVADHSDRSTVMTQPSAQANAPNSPVA